MLTNNVPSCKWHTKGEKLLGKKTNVIREFETIFDPFRRNQEDPMTVLIVNGEDHVMGELNMPEGVFSRAKEYKIILVEKERAKDGKR